MSKFNDSLASGKHSSDGHSFMKLAVLPGDGIGQEIIPEALKVFEALDLQPEVEHGVVGGKALATAGEPLPAATLRLVDGADAVLFGAVGDPRFDALPREMRPEQAILGLRQHLDLYANLRAAIHYPQLAGACTLRQSCVRGMDILVVRELTGDVYFGKPRGRRLASDGKFFGAPEGFDTMRYSAPEVERIARMAFQGARRRRSKVTSVDKANVLETSQLWRDVVSDLHAREFSDVALEHMYVDNAAMQLVLRPASFDVVLAGNLFGDILSDLAAAIAGSIGLLSSASLGPKAGLYEPGHGSAPDIAGKNIANPLATILSASLLIRHSWSLNEAADRVDSAVQHVLNEGYRTPDIAFAGCKVVGTQAMGDLVASRIRSQSK